MRKGEAQNWGHFEPLHVADSFPVSRLSITSCYSLYYIMVWENDQPMLMVFWFILLTNSVKVLTVCLTARVLET